MAVMANLFERLNAGRPPPTEEAAKQPIRQPRRGSTPIEKLQDWLVNHWTKPTITVREIRIYGPNLIRDGKAALSTAESLVERGWLVPLKVHRRDRREWQIVPKTSRSSFLQLIHQ
jgi:hypothetical protein